MVEREQSDLTIEKVFKGERFCPSQFEFQHSGVS